MTGEALWNEARKLLLTHLVSLKNSCKIWKCPYV